MNLGDIFNNAAYSDLEVVILDSSNGAKYAALQLHRAILIAQSDFFNKMLATEMREQSSRSIDIRYEDPESLQTILNFLYSHRAPLSPTRLTRLLAAASFLSIRSFPIVVEKYLLKRLDDENCCNLLMIARQFDLNRVKASCLHRCRVAPMGGVVQSSGWVTELNLDTIQVVMKECYEQVDEYVRLVVLVRWMLAMGDEEETRQGAIALLLPLCRHMSNSATLFLVQDLTSDPPPFSKRQLPTLNDAVKCVVRACTCTSTSPPTLLTPLLQQLVSRERLERCLVPAAWYDRVIHCSYGINSGDASLPGGLIAAGTKTGQVVLYDLGSGEELYAYQAHVTCVISISFHPSGRLLASGADDSNLTILDVDRLVAQTLPEHHQGPIYGVCWSPCGRRLISTGHDGMLRVVSYHATTQSFSIETVLNLRVELERRHLIERTGVALGGCCCSPDGKIVVATVSTGPGAGAYGFDLENGKEMVLMLRGHAAGIWQCVFSPDSRYLATASFDRTVRVYQLRPDEEEEEDEEGRMEVEVLKDENAAATPPPPPPEPEQGGVWMPATILSGPKGIVPPPPLEAMMRERKGRIFPSWTAPISPSPEAVMAAQRHPFGALDPSSDVDSAAAAAAEAMAATAALHIPVVLEPLPPCSKLTYADAYPRLVRVFGLEDELLSVAWSQVRVKTNEEDELLLQQDDDDEPYLLPSPTTMTTSTSTIEPPAAFPTRRPVRPLKGFAPRYPLLSGVGRDGIVRVWNVATGLPYATPPLARLEENHHGRKLELYEVRFLGKEGKMVVFDSADRICLLPPMHPSRPGPFRIDK